MTIALDLGEARAALYGLAEFQRLRALDGRPVPPQVVALLRRLDMACRTTHHVESSTRQCAGAGLSHLEHDWIGTGAAAELLGMEHRTVQRRAIALGGRKIHGRWWFPRHELPAKRIA